MKASTNNGIVDGSIETHGSFHSSLTAKHWLIIGLVVICILLFHFRNRIGEFHDRLRMNRRTRYVNLNDDFTEDMEQGLSSRNFDLINNAGDSREGLNEEQKEAIKKIMKDKGISFDKARLEFTKQMFGSNGVGPDGVPLDPKAVTFS